MADLEGKNKKERKVSKVTNLRKGDKIEWI